MFSLTVMCVLLSPFWVHADHTGLHQVLKDLDNMDFEIVGIHVGVDLTDDLPQDKRESCQYCTNCPEIFKYATAENNFQPCPKGLDIFIRSLKKGYCFKSKKLNGETFRSEYVKFYQTSMFSETMRVYSSSETGPWPLTAETLSPKTYPSGMSRKTAFLNKLELVELQLIGCACVESGIANFTGSIKELEDSCRRKLPIKAEREELRSEVKLSECTTPEEKEELPELDGKKERKQGRTDL